MKGGTIHDEEVRVPTLELEIETSIDAREDESKYYFFYIIMIVLFIVPAQLKLCNAVFLKSQ